MAPLCWLKKLARPLVEHHHPPQRPGQSPHRGRFHSVMATVIAVDGGDIAGGTKPAHASVHLGEDDARRAYDTEREQRGLAPTEAS